MRVSGQMVKENTVAGVLLRAFPSPSVRPKF